MSLGWEEDGMIEQEMIELCGSSDIYDLIVYCRSLKSVIEVLVQGDD